MAKPFSDSEAKRLRAEHRELLTKLKEAQQSADQNRQAVRDAAEAIISMKITNLLREVPVDEMYLDSGNIPVETLQKNGYQSIADVVAASVPQLASVRGIGQNTARVVHSLAEDYVKKARQFSKFRLSADNRSEEYMNLVRAVAACRATRDKYDACYTLHDSYSREVNRALNDIAPGVGLGIKWLFASGEKKRKAEQAYGILSGPEAANLQTQARTLLREIEDVSRMADRDAWSSMVNDPMAFMDFLEEIVPDAIGKNATELGLDKSFTNDEATQLCSEHKDMLERLEAAQTDAHQVRSDVRIAAETALTRSVMILLRDVPVEELNRDHRGIRVKFLQAAGYNNMADVVAASVYQLASVYGISEDMAYTIHSVADDYVNTARKSAKLRLSADNRSEEYTKLVGTIAVYRATKVMYDEGRSLHHLYEQKVKQALLDITIGICSRWQWLHIPEERKKRAEKAYEILWGAKAREYLERARTLLREIKDAKEITNSEAWEQFTFNPIAFVKILEDIIPEALGTDDAKFGLPAELAQEIQDQCFFPDGLLCELRRYQEWGVKYILHQEKVLLGDEMGLGKTVQAIASMVSLKNTGATHFMVVCPAGVIINWCREIREKSKLRVTKIHGAGRMAALRDWIKTGGVAVTTYETAAYIHLAPNFMLSELVVDEAHYIKNPDANRTFYVKTISTHAERILFMTGTALENKADEMVALIRLLQPDIANRVANMTFMALAPQFREKVAPVYYRRKREDVLTELPEKVEIREWCTLLPEEEEVYERAVLSRNYNEARRVSWNVGDLKKSSKARRLMELVEDAEADGRKVIAFSFYLDTIRKICDLLGHKCMNPINGSVTPSRRQEIIDDFDKSPAGTVLPAQINSGGTGLNIQSASVVILCEPQLKPSIENQAISRAYRMGQARNVLVFRLLCENTVDEKITKMLEEKQHIFDEFADKSVAAAESIALEEQTLGDIIEEEIKRINEKNGRVPA